MKTDNIEKRLNAILPTHACQPSMSISADTHAKTVAAAASAMKTSADAKELARMKYKEQQKLKREKVKYDKEMAKLGAATLKRATAVTESQKTLDAIEAIEAETVEPLDVTQVAQQSSAGPQTKKMAEMMRLQGASRPEIAKLLTGLNINLSVQLTKQDTANLLACLLTCNESQLQALEHNKKIPIVIKTVIKRLMDDMKLGNIDTIEKLWDRVFGKGQMQLNLPEQQQLQTGILPDVPISREAYIIIRDTLMK